MLIILKKNHHPTREDHRPPHITSAESHIPLVGDLRRIRAEKAQRGPLTWAERALPQESRCTEKTKKFPCGPFLLVFKYIHN